MSFRFPHIHLPVHAVFDIAHDVTEKIDNTVHRVKIADKALKIISGVHAFRHYDWLRNAPRLNVAGNLRGMVVNSRWKTAFLFSSKLGHAVEEVEPIAGKMNLYASIALNVVNAVPDFERVAASHDAGAVKAGKFGALAESVAAKTLIGMVEGPRHAVFQGLSKVCSMSGMLFHNQGLSHFSHEVDDIDVKTIDLEDDVSNPKKLFRFFNPTLAWESR